MRHKNHKKKNAHMMTEKEMDKKHRQMKKKKMPMMKRPGMG